LDLAIRIIRPSSREKKDLLSSRIKNLEKQGISVRYDESKPCENWPYTAANIEDRAADLSSALMEKGTDAVVCARGGYGASDLLELLPWEEIKKCPPKLLVGFSDISALHSAISARLGWPSLHGPMPATELWQDEGESESLLWEILQHAKNTGEITGSLPLTSHTSSGEIEGELFGGCFTVLTSLIGTPWLPKTAGKVLFFEDIGENPARIMRGLNQWIQSGLFAGVKAVVFGPLLEMGDEVSDSAPFVYEELAKRCPVPLFTSNDFGHTSRNTPLLIGAKARVEGGRLTWEYNYK